MENIPDNDMRVYFYLVELANTLSISISFDWGVTPISQIVQGVLDRSSPSPHSHKQFSKKKNNSHTKILLNKKI